LRLPQYSSQQIKRGMPMLCPPTETCDEARGSRVAKIVGMADSDVHNAVARFMAGEDLTEAESTLVALAQAGAGARAYARFGELR
jgi:hypothetical protein